MSTYYRGEILYVNLDEYGALSSRPEFDAFVANWRRENPKISSQVSDDVIEYTWDRINGQAVPSAEADDTPVPVPDGNKIPSLQNASDKDVKNARKTVQEQVAQASLYSAGKGTSIHRNNYHLKGKNFARAEDVNAYSPSEEAKEAAALAAEADAEELDSKGDLYRTYDIPKLDSAGNIVYETHQARPHERRDGSKYWLEEFGAKAPGNFPFGDDNDDYKVFRNVKDYGAKGDGKSDDTVYILIAMVDGKRCGSTCGGSTTKGALVYFPVGMCASQTPLSLIANRTTRHLLGQLTNYRHVQHTDGWRCKSLHETITYGLH